MTEGLREFDDSMGRCCHCDKLVFKSDKDWGVSNYGNKLCHRQCDGEYMDRASQI